MGLLSVCMLGCVESNQPINTVVKTIFKSRGKFAPNCRHGKIQKCSQSDFDIFFLHKPFSGFYIGNRGQDEKFYTDFKIFTQTWFAVFSSSFFSAGQPPCQVSRIYHCQKQG